jgi:2',3'-cyclic-nucleotide 2'-phosphodiesterase (5'-nucleotidase family)
MALKMKRELKMKKLFMMLVMISNLFCFTAISAPEETIVTIFHTADIHGRAVRDENNSVIGYSTIAGIRESEKNSILVDSGDFLNGSPFSNLDKGKDIVEIMNLVGYDIANLGSNDFNYGLTQINELAKLATFDVLSSNVLFEGKPIQKDTIIKEINGIKVGFFGITSPTTRDTALPENIVGIEFADPSEIAQKRVKQLKADGADVIVAITHLGENTSGTSVDELAAFVSGINVIIDGFSHKELKNGKLIGQTLIVNPGAFGNNMGRIDLKLNDKKQLINFSTTFIDFNNSKNYPSNKKVEQEVSKINAEHIRILEEVVGKSEVAMSAEVAPGLKTQTMPIGNFVADAFRNLTKADIALISGGSIKAGLKQGNITRADLNAILPLGNYIQTKVVTPKILKDALENSFSTIVLNGNGEIDYMQSQADKFPQISGFKVDYNPKNNVGKRVIKMTLDNGKELDPYDEKTKIILASTNYILDGGDEYDILKIPALKAQFVTDVDVITSYIASIGTVKENSQIRVNVTDKQPSMIRLIIISLIVLIGLVVAFLIVSRIALLFR